MARLVALAAALLALSGVAQAGAPPPDPTGYWAPYAEGKAVVYTAKEMLAALNTSTGVIMLCGTLSRRSWVWETRLRGRKRRSGPPGRDRRRGSRLPPRPLGRNAPPASFLAADIFLKPEDYLPYIPINVSAPGRTVMLRGGTSFVGVTNPRAFAENGHGLVWDLCVRSHQQQHALRVLPPCSLTQSCTAAAAAAARLCCCHAPVRFPIRTCVPAYLPSHRLKAVLRRSRAGVAARCARVQCCRLNVVSTRPPLRQHAPQAGLGCSYGADQGCQQHHTGPLQTGSRQ